ncbi:hypothetical protein PG988_009368 [Apiospora saccharicola]
MVQRLVSLTLWEFRLGLDDELRAAVHEWLIMSWDETQKALTDKNMAIPPEEEGMRPAEYYYRKAGGIASLIKKALREREAKGKAAAT